MNKTVLFGAFAAAGAMLATSASAFDMAEHYAGKTVTILYGYGSGGTYGKTSLLLSRHIGKFIPGNPTVITQSMPGAGGLKSANYAANVMPKDGHNLLMPPDMSLVSEVLRPKKVKYKTSQFTWLGRVFGSNNLTGIRRDSGITTVQEAMKKQIIMGSTGKGSPTFIVTALMNGLLGTKFKIVTGYKGSARTKQAMEQGEVQGITLAWASWNNDKRSWYKDGGNNSFAVGIAQSGFDREEDWPNVPTVAELCKTKDCKSAALLVASSSLFGRGLALPPGAPKELVKPLREAVWKAIQSDGFKADAKKTKLPYLPKTGAQIQDTLEGLMKDTSDAAIEMARSAIFGGKS
jgi:tripartite-type tricarboxylate transporter receptor subunit TctC